MAGGRGLAEEVRTRLEDEQAIGAVKNTTGKVHYLDELSFRKPIRQHVAEFAAVFAVIFLGIAAVKIYKGGSLNVAGIWTGAALVLITLGYKAPAVLHPLWKGWMKFAHVLGLVMTTLILAVAWTVALLPTAFGLKIFGVKVMDLSFDRSTKTYWENREAKSNNFKLLERQF